MRERLLACGRSFPALPRWVQWWVAGVPVPVNTLPFAYLDTPTGREAAIASLVVGCTNVPIMIAERSMSRLMSVPHLIAWIPLLLLLVYRLQSPQPPIGSEWILAIALVTINGISLIFDAFDSYRWLRRKRAIFERHMTKEF